ncbi:histidine phosphatase family protein [Streptomyces sp. NPDC000410]|uniref:histidine phosphatase family protein n=1 Tax=Streptomyces sp. NPDC000410 TaxID=3154254 RepID=UPI0033307965
MTVRLTFVCTPAVDAALDAAFGDGPVDERGLHAAGASGAALPPHALALRAPSARCAQTARALGLVTRPELALRDVDYGTWRGRKVREIADTDPYGLSTWLTDPDAAPHGGETVRGLCERVADWLSSLPSDTGRVLAVAEPAVVRAALVHALSLPARAFWHVDVQPLSAVTLTSRRDGGWDVQLDRVPLSSHPGLDTVEHIDIGRKTEPRLLRVR